MNMLCTPVLVRSSKLRSITCSQYLDEWLFDEQLGGKKNENLTSKIQDWKEGGGKKERKLENRAHKEVII